MIKVFFENRFEQRIPIGEVEEESDIYEVIKNDLSKRAQPSFQWHYTRTWKRENGEIVFDVGSWSEYYIATKEPNI